MNKYLKCCYIVLRVKVMEKSAVLDIRSTATSRLLVDNFKTLCKTCNPTSLMEAIENMLDTDDADCMIMVLIGAHL